MIAGRGGAKVISGIVAADSTGDQLRAAADRLLQTQCGSATLRAADQGVWPAALWTAIEEAGLTRALIPEAAGGFGVAPADALSLLRVAAAHRLPLPLAETMLASWVLADAGLTIPDGPLSIGPVRDGEAALLTPAAGGWLISGTLTRVPWGRNAGFVAVSAVCDGQPWAALVGPDAWTATPGENVAREPRDTLRLDGQVVAAAPAGITAPILIAAGAAMRTQQIAGALTRLTEMTVRYAQDRVQFGRPIGKFQAVQQTLAVLAGQAAAAVAGADLAADALAAFCSGEQPAAGVRSVTDRAGTGRDARPALAVLPIAAGKARAGEAAGIAAGIAHQVHGAIGVTFEHDLHFLTSRLWSWRDEFGKESAWNRVLGLHMARAGADRLWQEITAA